MQVLHDLFKQAPSWNLKGTNLHVIEWFDDHPFIKSNVAGKVVVKYKSTNLYGVLNAVA